MSDNELLDNITIDPAVLVGKPVIRNTRLSVQYIVNLLAHGATVGDILAEYANLKVEDIQACLLYASKALDGSAVLSLDATPA